MAMPVARPVCALLIYCSLFYFDAFFQVASASTQSRDGVTRSNAPETGSFSRNAVSRPFGAVSRPSSRLIWDFDSRLVGAVSTVQGTMSFAYDVDGIRTAKTVAGTVTKFVVEKNRDYAQVVEERSATNAVMIAYVRGDDLASQENPTVALWQQLHFYHHDGHASARQLTDASSSLTDTYAFDALGVTLVATGPTVNSYLYAGEQFDASLNFYYLRARYMNQATGRFSSADGLPGAITDPLSLHRYLYGQGDAVNRRDPSGMFTSLSDLLSAIGVGLLIYTIASHLISAGLYAARALGQSDLIQVIEEGPFEPVTKVAMRQAIITFGVSLTAAALGELGAAAEAAHQFLALSFVMAATLGVYVNAATEAAAAGRGAVQSGGFLLRVIKFNNVAKGTIKASEFLPNGGSVSVFAIAKGSTELEKLAIDTIAKLRKLPGTYSAVYLEQAAVEGLGLKVLPEAAPNLPSALSEVHFGITGAGMDAKAIAEALSNLPRELAAYSTTIK